MNTAASPYAALHLLEFRYLLTSAALSTLANRALAVVIGYQIYDLTHNPLALGWLGLVEAVPAISLALFGGHLADRTDRRRIVLLTRWVWVLCGLALAYISLDIKHWGVLALYAVIFVAGLARGFSDPAASAFEAQVVPKEYFVNASMWMGSMWQACSIIGPALGGFAFAFLGAAATYALVTLLFFLAWLSTLRVEAKPIPVPEPSESIFHSIAEGVRYVWRHQILIGSMALDMFAVLFGGAIALLPIFAKDILAVGPTGLGFMVAAPSVGALLVMLWATRNPPTRNAGAVLLWSVAGFGVSIIVFALSKNFVVSLLALGASGAFDGISMVVRRSILRLFTPDAMRGRVSAVSQIFIGSSNEIGAFESGFAASLLGTVRSVWLGGLVTLAVVAFTAWRAPKLRGLSLEPSKHPEME